MTSVLLTDNKHRYLIVEDNRVFPVNIPGLASRLVFRVADAIKGNISDDDVDVAFKCLNQKISNGKKIEETDLNHLERLVSQAFYQRIVLPSSQNGHCSVQVSQDQLAFKINSEWMATKWENNLDRLGTWDKKLFRYQTQYAKQSPVLTESTPLCSFGDIFFSCGAKIKKLWNAFCEAFILFWTWTKSSKQPEEKKQETDKVYAALKKARNALDGGDFVPFKTCLEEFMTLECDFAANREMVRIQSECMLNAARQRSLFRYDY